MNDLPTIAEADAMAAAMRLPVFVYGTLRPGCGNDRLWRFRATARHDGVAWIEDYSLVGHGFPYAIDDPGATTTGALIVPAAEHYDDVLADMDALEGVGHGHYDRRTVAVHIPDGIVVAWIYTPANSRYAHGNVVPTNTAGHHDWSERNTR